MHYTGMAAVSVHLHDTSTQVANGQSGASLLLPMLIGPVIFLILAGAIVMFDPVLILGQGEWNKSAGGRSGSTGGNGPGSPVAPDREDLFASHDGRRPGGR